MQAILKVKGSGHRARDCRTGVSRLTECKGWVSAGRDSKRSELLARATPEHLSPCSGGMPTYLSTSSEGTTPTPVLHHGHRANTPTPHRAARSCSELLTRHAQRAVRQTRPGRPAASEQVKNESYPLCSRLRPRTDYILSGNPDSTLVWSW